ncbi:hypothetical protein BC827DRAFT_1214302 [Russula dissimulans]|nr:hypothetical protein BC827DRAFT_1214302 [Russula dissimulans]
MFMRITEVDTDTTTRCSQIGHSQPSSILSENRKPWVRVIGELPPLAAIMGMTVIHFSFHRLFSLSKSKSVRPSNRFPSSNQKKKRI